MRIQDRSPFSKMIGHLFLDSWIAMLCLGALASQLSLPFLAIPYWTVVLIIIVVQAIAPEHVANWKIGF